MISLIQQDFLILFSGKALVAAVDGLRMLNESITAGEWLPSYSRRCRSVFRMEKASMPQKFRKKMRRELFKGERPPFGDSLYHIDSILLYGERFNHDNVLAKNDPDPVRMVYIEHARGAVRLMRPVKEAMDALDRVRPKPVITQQQASPTVTKTLNDLGASKVEVCPIKWIERADQKGIVHRVAVLDWPEGTLFGTSRFCGNNQCQACGHGIRNPSNWLPLLLTTAEGPKALWVGFDCGHTLFGFKVRGDLVIEGERKGLT